MIFEQYVLTSLEVRKRGSIKSDKDVAKKGAEGAGIVEDRTKAQVEVMDKRVQAKINNVVTKARNYMKSVTVPWSTSRNDQYGSRISNAEYLLAPELLPEYEAQMSEFRQEFEDILEKHLFSQWDRLKAEALSDLNGKFQDWFIPVEDLRKCYHWKVWIKPLVDVGGVEDDIRVKASRELVERVASEVKLAQEQKISNAVASVADSILSEAQGIIDGLDGYSFTPGDNRKSNTLPKAKGWNRLADTARRAEQWTKALENENLSESAGMIRDLVSELEKLGGGSISDAREALRDDTKRKEVKEKVESIASKARESQANALEDWMN